MLAFTSAIFILIIFFLLGVHLGNKACKFLSCKLKQIWVKINPVGSKGITKKTTASDLLVALRACNHTHSGEGISRKDLNLKDIQCHPLISDERAEEFKNSILPTATLIGHITTDAGFTGVNAKTIFAIDIVRYVLAMYGEITAENVDGTTVFKLDTKDAFNEYSLYYQFECILDALGIKNVASTAMEHASNFENRVIYIHLPNEIDIDFHASPLDYSIFSTDEFMLERNQVLKTALSNYTRENYEHWQSPTCNQFVVLRNLLLALSRGEYKAVYLDTRYGERNIYFTDDDDVLFAKTKVII